MIGMTLPVIATTYLDGTNQWETVGFQRRNEAIQHIKTGYTRQLGYRKPEGCFSVITFRACSSWLTAYVVKVFAMAYDLVDIDNDVICNAVKYLILNTQQPDGMFRELGNFCPLHPTWFSSLQSLPGSIDRAVAYLEKRLPSLTNPYAVAMTSYALANENKLNREILYKFVSPDLSHWPLPKGHVYTLEATAYALLALVKAKLLHITALSLLLASHPVFLVTNNFQAIEKFSKGGWVKNLTNIFFFLTYLLYLSYSVYSLYRYKDKERDASMSVLDIGLLTGFTVNITDLDLLSKGRARIISKYEMDTLLSEKGSLIIYLDKVSHTRPEEISFRIHQKMKVGVLQPAAVSVYEYYDQKRCVKFYHPERRAGQLKRLCRNDECICGEGKEETQAVTQQCATCFLSAYKVRVENYTEGLSTDTYQVRIVNVIKEGDLDVDLLGKVRTFLSHPHCREAVDMRKDKTYLIMGTFKDLETIYMLGGRTWIEYWPTEEECQDEEHRPTCLGIVEMIQQYSVSGCQQK
uniref:NTR domain-containing protein n=1 Tax=Monopterus albus TaxID=43700 RepID=A0A3Q3IVK3_MONAL